MNPFIRGFHVADALLWTRRWWLMMVPSLLLGGFFLFLPDAADSATATQPELQIRWLIAAFIGLLAWLLIASFICLSHAIARRQTKWLAGLVLFFPLTVVPYLYAHRTARD